MNNNLYKAEESREEQADIDYYYRNRSKGFIAVSLIFSVASLVVGIAPALYAAVIFICDIFPLVDFLYWLVGEQYMTLVDYLAGISELYLPLADLFNSIGEQLMTMVNNIPDTSDFMINTVVFLLCILATVLGGFVPGIFGAVFAIKTRFEINGMPKLSMASLVVALLGIAVWLFFLIVMFLHWGNDNNLRMFLFM